MLFDVDGTLVDSNYLHVHAWQRAFRELGRDVDSWRVHRAIGMGSGKLLADLLGQADADELGDRLEDLHSRCYLETAGMLRPFDQATKPDPEPVYAALERAGTEPGDTIFVGDSVWDVHAAARAGVRTVAVLSGGVSAAELTEAGAVATYDDPAALLDGLDHSPLAELFT